MSKIVTYEPVIASTCLFMEHREITYREEGRVANTDGQVVKVWPAYFDYIEAEQVGVLLHEYIHVILSHPERMERLRRKDPLGYDHQSANIAADCIVNEGMIKGSKARYNDGTGPVGRMALPAGCVRLEKIVAQAKEIEAITGIEVGTDIMGQISKITLEWLYNAFLKLKKAAEKKLEEMESCSSASGTNSGSEGEGSEQEPGSENNTQSDNESDQDSGQDQGNNKDQRNNVTSLEDEKNKKKLRDFLGEYKKPNMIEIKDLQALEYGDLNERMQRTIAKLKNALGVYQGTGRGSAIEVLQNDIPEVTTRWETSFRTRTQKHLSRQRVRQPSRPSSRVLTQEAMKFERIIWSAGRTRPRVPRVIVVLDSSGSVDARQYLRYLGEVQAMKKRTNAQIFVVVADADVQSVQEIDHVDDIREIEFLGRGGTDFRPALTISEEMGADLVVYLTDLMGTFPEKKPPFPVIWTVPEEANVSNPDAPFGEILLLS